MVQGGRCKEEVIMRLKDGYDYIVKNEFKGDYLRTIQEFDRIAENRLRQILGSIYSNQKSMDQAWKSCKGKLYEYAVFKTVNAVISEDNILKSKLKVVLGDTNTLHESKIVIPNWSEIYPDADIIIIDTENNKVKAILSCKTSLRERLTETAFWRRELERLNETKDVKMMFVTTDKDNELRLDTNRYIAMHVLDYTIITDLDKYEGLIKILESKYRSKRDFEELQSKIRPITELKDILKTLITTTPF